MELTTAYLCLGSNIEPKQHIASAVKKIQGDFEKTLVSSIYQTRAQGFAGDDFLNLAIEINTQLSLTELLAYTDALEQAAGRQRLRRGNFDARTLDVDVVVYGDLVGRFEGKVFPAEDLSEYGHVLKPLAEIAKQAKDPLSGRSFQQLWDRFEGKQEFEKDVQAFDNEWLYFR